MAFGILSCLLLLGSLTLVQAQAKCPSNKSEYARVTLPWGTVVATACSLRENIPYYTFANVAFGQSTAGTRRFKASVPPNPVSNNKTLLDQSKGPPCLQIPSGDISCPSSQASAPREPNLGSPVLSPGVDADEMSEDCLFLDLYVPVSAVGSTARLPVIVWFYGGAYLFGAKDNTQNLPFYQGYGVAEAAADMGQEVVFIAGNYRLGPLGWLAGTTMQQYATPNAGLTDQRLLLEFVQKYVASFGGNPANVNAWGESAGGGSILHHLISWNANNTLRDPLFRRAIVQSAAFQWQWNNTRGATLDQVFTNFTKKAGCSNAPEDRMINCLQSSSSTDALNYMIQWWKDLRCSGVYNIGPAVDGKLIKQLPAFAFGTGGSYPIDSIIASHVYDESAIFVPAYIKNNSGFNTLLANFLPGNWPYRDQVRACIRSRYLRPNHEDESANLMIRDALFTCNTRFVYNGMSSQSKPAYLMDYEVGADEGAALHGSDLLPTFWYHGVNQTALADAIKALCKAAGDNCSTADVNLLLGIVSDFRKQYQKYFVGHAVNGNPNLARNPYTWYLPGQNSEGKFTDVLGVYPWDDVFDSGWFWNKVTDKTNDRSRCSFWTEMALDLVTGRRPTCPPLSSLPSQDESDRAIDPDLQMENQYPFQSDDESSLRLGEDIFMGLDEEL